MRYYSPRYELNIPRYGLVEAGQILSYYDSNQKNDDVMRVVGMLVPIRASTTSRKQSCFGCGKHFVSYSYLILHKKYGCGRTLDKMQFHGLWEEEPQRYAYELHLLGVAQ